MSGIGLLNEKPLHASLKEWYAQPGDRFEVPLDGYIIDIVRDDLLVEIQTANLGSIKAKLDDLVRSHRIRLVYPQAQEKRIVKLAKRGKGRCVGNPTRPAPHIPTVLPSRKLDSLGKILPSLLRR